MSTTSETTCDGCRKEFPLLSTSTGHCAKCAALSKHPRTSEMFKSTQEWPQCVICGDSWMTMPSKEPVQICESVKCLELAPSANLSSSSAGDSSGPSAQSGRSYTQSGWFTAKMQAARGDAQSSGFESSLTTATLKQRETELRNLSGSNTLIQVSVQVRLSSSAKSVDPLYGKVQRAMAGNTILTELQNRALGEFNETHTKDGRLPFELSETLLRLSGNRPIENNKMSFTLLQWQNYALDNGLIELAEKPKAKPGAARAKLVNDFELFVIEHLYYQRLERSGLNSGDASLLSVATRHLTRNKRRDRAPSMVAAQSQSASKIPRTQATTAGPNLRSAFALPSSRKSSDKNGKGLLTSTKVELQIFKCSKITASGDTVLEKEGKITAYISDLPFARGGMKAVFEITIDSVHERHVVKRFFKLEESSSDTDSIDLGEISTEPTPFTAPEHNEQIQHELVRLVRGAQFLKAFYKQCNQEGVPIYQNFRFVNARLLQETGHATPASGMRLHQDEPWPIISAEDGLTWLTEQRFASDVVERFSGTLNFRANRAEIKYLTMYAFTHFSYVHSNGQLIFADLQGSPGPIELSNGKMVDGVILFDPMTHTTNGESGIGDFGEKGLDEFLKQHQCSRICQQLGLNDVNLEPGNGEGDQGESDRQKKTRNSEDSVDSLGGIREDDD